MSGKMVSMSCSEQGLDLSKALLYQRLARLFHRLILKAITRISMGFVKHIRVFRLPIG
jgi:hypothetical protein